MGNYSYSIQYVDGLLDRVCMIPTRVIWRSLTLFFSISPFYSDIYVFGIGEVHSEEINKLVSKKHNEKHFFILKSHAVMEKMLDQMISKTGKKDITKSV